ESNVFENISAGSSALSPMGGVFVSHLAAASQRSIVANTFRNAVRGVTLRKTQAPLAVAGNAFLADAAVSVSSRAGVWIEDVRSNSVDVRGNNFDKMNLGWLS
ncbi:MAG: hypothetical protein RMM53_07660, partial [Bacteroidia bacterium]|nr:hypothetical protein [Bacteroidia bacterium]